MKIGILTFQGAKNFGAVLQAYGLTTVLKNRGYSAEIINFISDSEYERNLKKSGKKGKAYWARQVYYLFFFKSVKKRNELFELFQRNYLSLFPSNRRIREKELEEYAKHYQCIICGSDQIWSQDPKLYDRSDAYFINFPFEGKRVSYAASFGDKIEYTNEDKLKDKIIKYVKRFDYVSVREIEAAEFLENNGIEATVCVDPTLLLGVNEWKKIAAKPKLKEKYILYYSVNSRKYSIDIAKHLAHKTGLKVIELNPHPKSWNSGFKKLYGNGPKDFLGYILNAEYIVTNSFHGTVFSILFNKPFVAAFDEKNGQMILENRKASLLKCVGLESAMVTASTKLNIDKINNIDWDTVNSEILKFREDSMAYLDKALGEN